MFSLDFKSVVCLLYYLSICLPYSKVDSLLYQKVANYLKGLVKSHFALVFVVTMTMNNFITAISCNKLYLFGLKRKMRC